MSKQTSSIVTLQTAKHPDGMIYISAGDRELKDAIMRGIVSLTSKQYAADMSLWELDVAEVVKKIDLNPVADKFHAMGLDLGTKVLKAIVGSMANTAQKRRDLQMSWDILKTAIKEQRSIEDMISINFLREYGFNTERTAA